MATTVIGVQGRRLAVDGNNKFHPESVFVSGARGFAMEIARESFIEAVCREFDLVPREENVYLLRTA